MKMKYLTVLCICFIASCSSSKTQISSHDFVIVDKASFVIEDIQYQRWVSNISGGGSGYHIYISVSENMNTAHFDSIYFRGYAAKIEVGKMGYFAAIQTQENRKEDIIMSNSEGEEYGNSPKILQNKQFDFGENTCVINYIENDQVFYFKFDKMIKKEL